MVLVSGILVIPLLVIWIREMWLHPTDWMTWIVLMVLATSNALFQMIDSGAWAAPLLLVQGLLVVLGWRLRRRGDSS